MRARAEVVAELRNGRTVHRRLRSDPPLLLRPAAGRLLLVGGAAGPLGGDELELRIIVGPAAHLHLSGVAASLALPGPTPSSFTIDAEVGPGAELWWDPQPLVSVTGSRHHQSIRIHLAADARLHWHDRTVFGRSGQPPGQLTTSLRIERAADPADPPPTLEAVTEGSGRPEGNTPWPGNGVDREVLLHQDLDLGLPALDGSGPELWSAPAVLDGARALVTRVTVDRLGATTAAGSGSDDGAARSSGPGWRVARSPLAPDLVVATGVGHDLATVERRLDDLDRRAGGGDPGGAGRPVDPPAQLMPS